MLAAAPMIETMRVTLAAEDDFEGWRDAARGLAEAGVPGSAIVWQVEGGEKDLFGGDDSPRPPAPAPSFAVPRRFVDLARSAICHSDPERFSLLYAMLLKLSGNKRAMEDRADPLLDRLERLAKEVRRDVHKMHAFIRFREVDGGEGPRFVAWFQPDHHIVRHAAGFFVRRFTSMRWSILTPELSIHWDDAILRESPGATRADAPDGDPIEETWKTYYASIFNPARLKVKAMTREMPKKYWRNMPETALVGSLIAGAQGREAAMIERSAAMPMAGGNLQASWQALRDEAKRCTRCDLYKCGTQTVFGEGPLNASIITTYVTNAVKHFKFVLRGKKRIHSKPDTSEIDACRWWQEQERGVIRPALTVALGATAARSLTGKTLTISRARETPLTLADGSECWITVHPSFLLRIPEEDRRREERARFVDDLVRIRKRAAKLAA
ncbi:MAG: TIGR03915 family putative DNA repair protein [Sphingomonadales bacterium]|nr:TIGR03915 family putative DNA repair protein [Sphingomonadales bacterium]